MKTHDEFAIKRMYINECNVFLLFLNLTEGKLSQTVNYGWIILLRLFEGLARWRDTGIFIRDYNCTQKYKNLSITCQL